MIGETELRRLLKKRCLQGGGIASWATKAGISPQYVGDCLNGRRSIGKKILQAVGYDKIVGYKKVRDAK